MQLLLLTLAGWVNRDQQAVIEYLREENRVLRELLPKKRPPLTDAQRRRLAVKAQKVARSTRARAARDAGQAGAVVPQARCGEVR